jgi:murein DD-endopeptidase MepM/ murein hydrolase activator NlpD
MVRCDSRGGPRERAVSLMARRKRSLVYVTEDAQGGVERVSIPMRYVYGFVAAAIVGAFTIAGMAGSYTRMLAKTEGVNHLRAELAASRTQYASLEKQEHEKAVQAASLGSLAGEVSALYGLTAGKLTLPHRRSAQTLVADAKHSPLTDTGSDDAAYYKSLDTFYALRDTASSGRAFANSSPNPDLGVRATLSDFGALDAAMGSNVPDMWPILGPITSGFGERVDPVLGMGIGEFHKGVDIGSPDGTPVHAPAAGRVIKAGMENGYGRVIEIDHGNGIKTIYGHLQGWNVIAGEMVVKGQVIGFVGHSGKTTGSHLHYEVQIHDTAVNPHRYLRITMAQLGGTGGGNG